MQNQILVSHSALFCSLHSSLSLSTFSLCGEKEIMRKGREKEAERRETAYENRTAREKSRRGGALECSCNQGLCTQEGPINPAVCLYISSGILKTAKNESPGPGCLLRPLRVWATGAFAQSVIQQRTQPSRKSELQSNCKENDWPPAEREVFTATEMESVLFSISDVTVNTQVCKPQPQKSTEINSFQWNRHD